MGRKPSIDAQRGRQLLDAYQRLGSQNAAARAVGVSHSAASRWLRALPKTAAPLVAQQQDVLAAVVPLLEDARAALAAACTRGERLQQQLEQQLRAAREYPDAYAAVERMYLQVLDQARLHAETAAQLSRFLIDIEEVRTVQAAIVAALGEADPPTRERLLARLRTMRP
jgi:molybdenum-dependent DNA-binding transcriptional regulator ModE